MIKKVIKSIKKVFIPRSEFLIEEKPKKVEKPKENYIGVTAPPYLEEDPWFPSPVLSEKQISVKEAHKQAVVDRQILDESKEPEDIHQKLYESATKNWNTVGETQLSAQGGSENFQEGPGGWNSGTGIRQFHP